MHFMMVENIVIGTTSTEHETKLIDWVYTSVYVCVGVGVLNELYVYLCVR